MQGLQSANLPRKTPQPGSESPEPLPPHGYLLQVPPDRRDAPRSDLGDLYNPTLCDLVESLSARGNRAVLDIRVRTSTARPVLAEAIDTWYASRDTMNRTIESIDIPEGYGPEDELDSGSSAGRWVPLVALALAGLFAAWTLGLL